MEIIKDEKVIKIIEKIKEVIKLSRFNGHVYLVGGVVRDSLLGLPIKDVDVVVEGVDGGGTMVASMLAAREKCFKLGKNPVIYPAYNTTKVCLTNDDDLKDIDIEFADARKRAYAFNVDCTGTLEEDSKRRDLTINALYYDITTGKLIDYNNSIADFTNKTLRCPSPYTMFVEDPIKMLRVIRFSAELGWEIEKNTWLAMILNSSRLKDVVQEKISSEVSKILISPNPSFGVRKMFHSGVLKKVIPDVHDLISGYESRNPMVTAFDHTMQVLNTVQPILENRLAALFHDIGNVVTDSVNRAISIDMFSAEIAATDLKEMKFSNAVIDAVEKSIRYHRVFKNYADGVTPPDKKIRKFVSLCGEHVLVTMDLMHANNIHSTYGKKKRQALDILNRIEELDAIEEDKKIKLPVNGNDLIKELGIKKGPVIGILLNSIKDAYFENPNITREECLKIAKEKEIALAT